MSKNFSPDHVDLPIPNSIPASAPSSPMSIPTLIDLLQWRAKQKGHEQLYTYLTNGETEGARLTYLELDCQARAIAAYLQTLQVAGERALLLYPSGLDFISAFFGCLYAGVIAVPTAIPHLTRPDLRFQTIVEDAQPALLLGDSTTLTRIKRRFTQAPELSALHWVATDTIGQDHDIDTLADAWRRPVVDGESLAFLQYTSGSTALPKGVMVSHRNLLHNSALINQWYKDNPKTTAVSWAPFYHDMGLVGCVIQPLYGGFPTVLMSPTAFLDKPLRWLQAISHYRGTTTVGPNFAFDYCVQKIPLDQRQALDLSCWEVALNGAEPIQSATLDRFTEAFAPHGFRRTAFTPCYGMAESTVYVAGGHKSEPPVICTVDRYALRQNQVILVPATHANSQAIVGCGREWLGQQFIIVDPDSHRQCAPEQVGEIWIAGPSVTQGYWNQPTLTEETFHAYLSNELSNSKLNRDNTRNGNADGDADLDHNSTVVHKGPYLRTGDLGFKRNGELFITGRLKDLLIIRGRNHYPQDIEQTAGQSHPTLEATGSAAFTILDGDLDESLDESLGEGTERLVIVQEVKRSHVRDLDRDDLREELIDAICQAVNETHGLQTYALLLLKPMTIPKTSSGKVQRSACRIAFQNGTLNPIGVGGLFQLRDHTPAVDANASAESVAPSEEQQAAHADQSNLEQPKSESMVVQSTTLAERLQSADIEARRQLLSAYIQEKLAETLKISHTKIAIDKPLTSLGVDSLTAVDLRNRISEDLEVDLPMATLIEGPMIVQLVEYLIRQIALTQIMTGTGALPIPDEQSTNEQGIDEESDEFEEIVL